MSGLFRKNALVVSIFCALLEMGVSPTIVYASGMALEYEASQGDIVGNKYSITEPISSVVYNVFAAWHNGGGNVSENTLSVEKVLKQSVESPVRCVWTFWLIVRVWLKNSNLRRFRTTSLSSKSSLLGPNKKASIRTLLSELKVLESIKFIRKTI